jgi:hypothetical protein
LAGCICSDFPSSKGLFPEREGQLSNTEGQNEPLITAETVRELARVAELPLADDRIPALAEQLNGLLVEANLVNRFMDARREVQPGVRYHHPEVEESAH